MNTNINNGFIQRVVPENARTRDWQYRAWSNHRDGGFTFLTHSAAVYWLWVIDEIEGGRSNRTKGAQSNA